MTGRIAQFSLFAVALVIGMLLVAQLRSQARPIELSSLSAQELSELIQTVSSRNVELGDALADLREQIRSYEVAQVQGQSTRDLTRSDLERVEAFGGMRGIEGQGVLVTLEGAFDATAINDVIYELRGAGAEAISVDDIRITASSVAILGTEAVEIDGVALGRTVEIRAIGSPQGLIAAIDRPGGMLTLLEQSADVRFTREAESFLQLPATERDLAPQAARPVE